MSLVPERVERLRKKLYEKAKREPGFRFYSLYDKVCWEETLACAYRQVRANRGAPGVDGVRFGDIEEYGEDRWLGELRKELLEERYRAKPVKRVMIPKPGGGKRPLGRVIKAYQAVSRYVARRVRNFLRKRHKVRSHQTSRFGRNEVYGSCGVVDLRMVYQARRRTAKATL